MNTAGVILVGAGMMWRELILGPLMWAARRSRPSRGVRAPVSHNLPSWPGPSAERWRDGPPQ
jgi:hypothetical protein